MTMPITSTAMDPRAWDDYQEAVMKAPKAAEEQLISFRNAEREKMMHQWQQEGRRLAYEDLRQIRLKDILDGGGISRQSMEAAGYSKALTKELSLKRVGLIRQKSKVGIDEYADRFGFDSAEQFMASLIETPSLRLKDVYQFRSATTWKLYELLKQWSAAGRWSIDLDGLRMSLGIIGKYSNWRDFKKRILDNPIKEINYLSDIIVKYEKKKRIHAVTGVVFFINSKEKEKRNNDPSIVSTIGDTNNDIRLLMKMGLNQANAEYLSRLATDVNKDLNIFLRRIINRYEAKSE